MDIENQNQEKFNFETKKFLGDPQYYIKLFLKDPPLDDRLLDLYQKQFEVDVYDPISLEKFLISEKFLDFMCEFDFCLFCERKLKMVVRPHHVEWAQLLMNNQHVIIWAPRDHGKSSNLLATYGVQPNKGLLYYKDFSGSNNYKSTSKVLGKTTPIIGFHTNEITKTKRLVTKKGFEIEGTPHHKLAIHTPDGLEWKRLDELKKGDYLTLNRNTQCFGQNSCSSDMAFLAGFFIGDGCFADRSISLGCQEDYDTVTPIIGEVNFSINKDLKTKKGDRHRSVRLKKDYWDVFSKTFNFEETKSPQRSTPRFVREGTKEVVCGFLNGLFSSDAHVNKHSGSIEYCTASEQLARELQLMLFNLGILASWSKRDDVKAFGKLGTVCHRISIDEFLSKKRFYEQIGFRVTRKERDLEEILEKNAQITHTKVPYANEWIKGVREDIKFFKAYEGALNFDLICKNFSDGKSFVSLLNIMDKIHNTYKPFDSKHLDLLDFYSNPDILIDEIEQIEDSVAVTGDFEVDSDDHALIANGFISHNTQFFSRNYILWHVFYSKSMEIMLISSTEERAKAIMNDIDGIKDQVESNPDLSHLKPRGSEGKWAEKMVKFSNGVILRVYGFPPKRGYHPQLLIMDDILSSNNSLTESLREKTWMDYASIVDPMVGGGQTVIVGTSLHRHDLLHKLAEQKGQWVSKKYRALLNEFTKEVLWKERRSIEQLQKYRATYGEILFQQEYQNNPMAETLTYFPESIITPCLREDLSYVPRYVGDNPTFLGGDLSPAGGSKRGSGDNTVFSAIERVPTPHNEFPYKFRLLYYAMFKDDPQAQERFLDKQLDILKMMCSNFQIKSGFIEEVGFMSFYTKDFIERDAGMALPVKGYSVSSSGKRSHETGLPQLRALFERKLLELPYQTEEDKKLTNELIKQFIGIMLDDNGKFGNQGYHDDIPTSLWMAVEASKTAPISLIMGAKGPKKPFGGPKRRFIRSKRR